MNLGNLAAKAIETGFKVLEEFTQDITLLSNPVESYSRETGVNTITYTEQTVKGLQTAYESLEILNSAGSILFTDIRMLVKGADFTGDVEADWKVRIGTTLYEVRSPVLKNIAGTSVILQLRKI